MNDITYRDATLDDAQVIADLFAESFVSTFGHLYSKEDLDSFLSGITRESFAGEIADPRYQLRLASGDGHPVAFTKLGPPSFPDEPPPDTIELRQIYVLSPWQGAGIAARLYDDAEAEARRRGARHLQLSVYIDNHRARAFYDRRGFQAVGRYDFMVGNHVDEDIIMRKPL